MPALFTVEEVLTELGMRVGQDSFTEDWIGQNEPLIRGALEKAVGRTFGESQSVSWIFSGSGSCQIVLPDYGRDISLVEYRSANTWAEFDEPENFLIDGFVLNSMLYPFPTGQSNIRVTLTVGYDGVEDLEPQVRMVAIRLAAQLWALRPQAMGSSQPDSSQFNAMSKLMKSGMVRAIPRSCPGI